MDNFIRTEVLIALDKKQLLKVDHYEDILERAGEKTGFGNIRYIERLNEFQVLEGAIVDEVSASEARLYNNRKESIQFIRDSNYAEEEKDELLKVIRRKFTGLFDFLDSQKEIVRITFDDEYRAFVRSKYFKEIDHEYLDLSKERKDALFDFFFQEIKNYPESTLKTYVSRMKSLLDLVLK